MFCMKMMAKTLPTLLAASLTLTLVSCQMDPTLARVPEMPYRPRAVPAPVQEEPVQTTTWETAPEPSSFISYAEPAAPRTEAPIPTPAPVQAAAPKPVAAPQPAAPAKPVAAVPEPAPYTPPPAPEPKPAAVQPIQPLEISPIAAAPAAPSPAPAPAQTVPSAKDLKAITNTGPIPTAARVEGDPTRVWNPLDPSKKIRIINPKTNQPYPSGKKLKVRGTNFQFYVP